MEVVNPADNAPVPPEAVAPAPIAATIVVTSEKTERELNLESELEAARNEKKSVELRAMELEDENKRLKEVPAAPPITKREKKKSIRWTHFHADESED